MINILDAVPWNLLHPLTFIHPRTALGDGLKHEGEDFLLTNIGQEGWQVTIQKETKKRQRVSRAGKG